MVERIMSEGILFIVSAPSGAGKTSLVKALLARDSGLSLSVSCTTRAPRAGERDGVHYHFIDQARFRESVAAGEFLEHAEVFGNLYGTREADVREALAAGQDLILEIDWQGARQVRTALPECVSVFILPPSLGELERRLRGRGTDAEEVIGRRLRDAASDMTHWREFDHVVVNDEFVGALADLQAIVAGRAEATRRDRPGLAALAAELTGA
jgi:guanylate kinase